MSNLPTSNIPRAVGYNRYPGDSDSLAKEDHVHDIHVEDWTQVDLQNGWTHFTSGGHNPDGVTYLIDPLGVVRLTGTAQAGTIAIGTVLFNIPVEYRPIAFSLFPVPMSASGNWSTGIIGVSSVNGNVTIFARPTGTGFIMFTNVFFEANRLLSP